MRHLIYIPTATTLGIPRLKNLIFQVNVFFRGKLTLFTKISNQTNKSVYSKIQFSVRSSREFLTNVLRGLLGMQETRGTGAGSLLHLMEFRLLGAVCLGIWTTGT